MPFPLPMMKSSKWVVDEEWDFARARRRSFSSVGRTRLVKRSSVHSTGRRLVMFRWTGLGLVRFHVRIIEGEREEGEVV